MAARIRNLRFLLETHTPRDALESAHLTRMVELCESIADPLSRSSFEPGHFTASAFILSPERDALLLILLMLFRPSGLLGTHELRLPGFRRKVTS